MSFCYICVKEHSQEEFALSISIPDIRRYNQFIVLKDKVLYYERELEQRKNLFYSFLRSYLIDVTTNLPYRSSMHRIRSKIREILAIIFAETMKLNACNAYHIQNIALIHDTLFTEVSTLERNIEILFGQLNTYVADIHREHNQIEEEVYAIIEEEEEEDRQIYRPLLQSVQLLKKNVSKIEDLECKICYDTSDINKRCVLNCNHSLCIDCAYSHMNSTDEKQSTTITHYSCPICRSNITEINVNYVVSKSKKESFSKMDLISSESFRQLQTKCKTIYE